MTTSLANTIFQGNSSNAVVVEDAYKISTQESRNSVYDAGKGIYADAIKGMQSNKGSARELASLITASKSGSVNKMDMLTRGLSALGSSLPSLLGTLGGVLKNNLSSVAGDLIGDNASKAVSILYGNAELLLSVADVDDTESLVKFVNELSGNSELAKFINIEAESAIIGGMASMLMQYGIPEMVDDVIAQARSDAVKANAYAYLSTEAVNGSDLAMINKVIDQIGITMFLANNPDAINSILSGFFFGTKDTVDTYPAKRTELLTLLVRINPNWFQYNRAGTWVPNLGPFNISSKDAKTLFCTSDPERSFVLAAKGYPPNAATSVVKALYPDAYIPNN